jgi:hypothetical protein
MHNNTKLIALAVAGLLAAVGAIYLISAYEEPIEAQEESAAEGGSPDAGMDTGTLVQTIFFGVAGSANLGVAAWIIVSRKRMVRTPYIITAAGCAFLIVLYIASRTINLPIVGIQEDIGTIDILSKVLQGIAVGLSAYMVSISRKLNEQIKNRVA